MRLVQEGEFLCLWRKWRIRENMEAVLSRMLFEMASSPSVLRREEGDRKLLKKLSLVVPSLMLTVICESVVSDAVVMAKVE
jgi:hypothetical protein